LYLLIDEYDNFANELMTGHRATEESHYQAILSGEDCMKALFKSVKAAAGGQGLGGRVFITGVSPVTISDLTSAYNVSKNIYLQLHSNALCGFRETQIAVVLAEIAEECDLPQSKVDEALSMMRTFITAIASVTVPKNRSTTPSLPCISWKNFRVATAIRTGFWTATWPWTGARCTTSPGYPRAGPLIFDALAETESVTIFELADRFGVEDMLYAPKDTGFVASLLYYFGILTLGGITPFGELILTIPNLVTRKLYAESIKEMLLPEGKENDLARRAAEALYHAAIRNLCAISWNRNISRSSATADYAWSNELTVKTAFLTLLFNDSLYIMESETEIEPGHADLTMIVRPNRRQYQMLDILIEFKFVSLKEAWLDGKTLEKMDDAALRALPMVQTRQREAKVGLARYREKLERKFPGPAAPAQLQCGGNRIRAIGVFTVGMTPLMSNNLVPNN